MSEQRMASTEMVEEIRTLAAIRDHRLAPYMTDGRPMTLAMALNARRHLLGRPVRHSAGASPQPAAKVAPMSPVPVEPERVTQRTPVPLPEIPAGYYAIPSLTGVNDLAFYRVKVVTEGRWSGRTFVDQIVGGKPDFPVRGERARQVLRAIADAGIEESMREYGRSLGYCGRCNRHLTDAVSRSEGMGPECRRK